MRTVTVEVTQEDINTGRPGEPCGCPVALALGKALGLEDEICIVYGETVVFQADDGTERKVKLPEVASDFVSSFYTAYEDAIFGADDDDDDLGWREDFDPFSFTLELPEEPTHA